MRSLELWTGEEPPPRLEQSQVPFSADLLECEQWLQWVFLGRLAEIRAGVLRPRFRSNVAAYCEECFAARGVHATALLGLIRQCDELLAEMVSDDEGRGDP